MMKVKVCGITNLENAKLCCDLGADALGFIFYEKSKRYINFEDASLIVGELPAFVSKVGVFVNEEATTVNHIAQSVGLTHVQLHGNEDQHFISKINYPVIKALRVNENFDFTSLKSYSGCTILLDTYSDKEFGGTGISFDWNKIPMDLRSKVILAGGVSEENIETIFNTIKPQAVDISSSLESEIGKKDVAKLKNFFNIVNKLRFV